MLFVLYQDNVKCRKVISFIEAFAIEYWRCAYYKRMSMTNFTEGGRGSKPPTLTPLYPRIMSVSHRKFHRYCHFELVHKLGKRGNLC